MVAGYGDAVSHLVHQVQQSFPLGQKAHGISLDVVAVVNQDDLIALVLLVFTDLFQSGVAESLINSAVDITGKEDQNILFFRIFFLRLQSLCGRSCICGTAFGSRRRSPICGTVFRNFCCVYRRKQ